MAHEIDMSNGRENFAYVGDKAWHGLGRSLTEGAPLEVWTKEAGMEWDVLKSPVLYIDDQGDERMFPERTTLWRSDTKRGLGIVGAKYKPVQPRQVIEFFRDLADQNGFSMETAGCLFGGRKFWALAKTGKGFRLMGQDEIKPYLLVATSCDGSMSTCAHFTSVRVVCSNTLRMSVGSQGQFADVKVPHSTIFNPEHVKSQLGMANEIWEGFVETVEALAKIKMDRDEAIQIVADALKTELVDGMTTSDILDSSMAVRRIIHLYDGGAKGSEFRSAKGTGWGLINAVTEYFDHDTGRKTGDRSKAFERAHLTDRAKLKTQIVDAILKAA